MERKDKVNFAELMQKTRVSLPSQTALTPKEEAIRIDVFWETLKAYRIEIVAEAFEVAYTGLKWFPTPSHIIDIIRELENARYRENEAIGPEGQIEWMKATEEGKAIAKKFLSEIFEKLSPGDVSRLEGQRAEEFERKRNIAKSKAKRT